MRRFSLVLAAVLCGLTSIACKQGVGQRCEQPSDCASGFCNGSSSISNMTPATGRTCTAGPGTPPIVVIDAGPPPTDTADAVTGDAVGEAGGDAPTSDAVGDAAGADVSADSSSDASADASSNASADASSADGGSDAGLEAGPG